MKIGVIQFPGSNCDRDCVAAVRGPMDVPAELVWHTERDLSAYDALIISGGFSYGDYLRAGAIARFSPVMEAVRKDAAAGKPVLGICNGFQVLCESGLLPGALIRNAGLHFVCDIVPLEVVTENSPYTRHCNAGEILRLPIAHGEGCYFADEPTLDQLEAEDRVLLRYAGQNPNGSRRAIAGICNEARNVVGLMPHPERAAEARLGSTDGQLIFHGLFQAAREWQRASALVTA